MPQLSASARSRRRPLSAALLATIVSGLAVVAVTGMALAKSFTLRTAANAKVTNAQGVTKHEGIAVNAHGLPVYDLVPERMNHALCTKANQCLNVWFPVTVASAKAKPTAAPGIKGKLGVWPRNGFFQVTLAGHPLYTFIGDKKDVATGDTIKHFGGTWHVILAGSSKKKSTQKPPPTTTTTTTMTTPAYPPGY